LSHRQRRCVLGSSASLVRVQGRIAPGGVWGNAPLSLSLLRTLGCLRERALPRRTGGRRAVRLVLLLVVGGLLRGGVVSAGVRRGNEPNRAGVLALLLDADNALLWGNDVLTRPLDIRARDRLVLLEALDLDRPNTLLRVATRRRDARDLADAR